MNIGILGAGSMGRGIAQVSAMAGHDVVLRDVEREIVDDAVDAIDRTLAEGVELGKQTSEEMETALQRISGTTELASAVTDAGLVVEAAPEDLELKKDIFEDVATLAPTNAVLGTNTSSLSVTEIASAVPSPERVLGLHFFNPAHIMPLVEIIVAERTSDETVAFASEYVDGIDKSPIVVNDFPGFASSRLGAMYSLEALRMAQEGVASIPDIDETMRLGYNMPMGPIELVDHTGVDVNVDVLTYLTEELGERFRPPQILKRKYRAGKLGRKTGEGFYIWEDDEIVGVSGE